MLMDGRMDGWMNEWKLARLSRPAKAGATIKEIVEEMNERDREERGLEMKGKKLKK